MAAGNVTLMLIGWTTFATKADAEAFAADVVEAGWAACGQVEGPITSIYRWDGQVDRAEEYRLALKFLSSQRPALERHLADRHPYDTPEWIVVEASHVGEKYLSWAKANSSTPPL